jgi:hypothetical protein
MGNSIFTFYFSKYHLLVCAGFPYRLREGRGQGSFQVIEDLLERSRANSYLRAQIIISVLLFAIY